MVMIAEFDKGMFAKRTRSKQPRHIQPVIARLDRAIQYAAA